MNRSFHHIDLKQSATLEEVTKEANPIYFGKIFKDLQEFDKNLPTWTHGKTDPIWDLLQDQAMKLNDKSLVNWVVGDNFTDFLKGNMTCTNWTQYHGILSDDFNRFNACRSYILDSLDPYDKDQSIWSSKYIGNLSAWLLAISNESASDYFWNLENYEQPYIVDARTGRNFTYRMWIMPCMRAYDYPLSLCPWCKVACKNGLISLTLIHSLT